MLKFFEKIWKTIVRPIKTFKAWEHIAPPEEPKGMLNLNDLIQLKCIKSIDANIENCKDDEKKEEDAEDVEFKNGIFLYSLNDRVLKNLMVHGYTVYCGPREIYKAQKFELL